MGNVLLSALLAVNLFLFSKKVQSFLLMLKTVHRLYCKFVTKSLYMGQLVYHMTQYFYLWTLL